MAGFSRAPTAAAPGELEKGLPTLTGRIGLDVSQSDPKVVMAVIQSDQGGTVGIDDLLSRAGGVFRSEDGGESWTRMNALNPRPFYFSQLRIDPVNSQRVYVAGYMLHVSDNGGRSFREDLFGKSIRIVMPWPFPRPIPRRWNHPRPASRCCRL